MTDRDLSEIPTEGAYDGSTPHEEDFENDVMEMLEQKSFVSYVFTGSELRDEFGYNPSDISISEVLQENIKRINPEISLDDDTLDSLSSEVQRFLQQPSSISKNGVVEKKREFFEAALTKSGLFSVEDANGDVHRVKLIDTDDFSNNQIFAANQVTYSYGGNEVRFDVVIFVNGLPFVIGELKRVEVSGETAKTATRDLREYEKDVPGFFVPAMFSVGMANSAKETEDSYISPLYYRGFGTPKEYESPWSNKEKDTEFITGLDAFRDLCQLDILEDFYKYGQFFLDDDDGKSHIVARHQQFFVGRQILSDVRKKLSQMENEASYHEREIVLNEISYSELVNQTQGSGKTLAMLFAARWVREQVVKPWTDFEPVRVLIVVDRANLNRQLKNQLDALQGVSLSYAVADKGDELKPLLVEGESDVIVTTIQKFREVDHNSWTCTEPFVTFEDEIHREMLNKEGAKYESVLPNRIRYGFTGTPTDEIVSEFGNDEPPFFFHEYSLSQALREGVTVPVDILQVRPALMDVEFDVLDEMFKSHIQSRSDVTMEEVNRKVQRTGYSKFEEYWDKFRKEILDFVVADLKEYIIGTEFNAMMVCASRKLAAMYTSELKETIGDEKVAAVYSGTIEEYPDIGIDKDTAVHRYKDDTDPLQLVVVCEMLLTGFDSPPLKRMYLNRDISQQHTLEQALARVNRPMEGKSEGKILDFKGSAKDLEVRLQGKEFTTLNTDISEVLDKYKNALLDCRDFLGFEDWGEFISVVDSDSYTEYLHNFFVDYDDRKQEYTELFRRARSLREDGYPSREMLQYEATFKRLQGAYNYIKTPNGETEILSELVGEAGGAALEKHTDLSGGFIEVESSSIDKNTVDKIAQEREVNHRIKELEQRMNDVETQFAQTSFSERFEHLYSNWISNDMSVDKISGELDSLECSLDKAEEESIPEAAQEIQSHIENKTGILISEDDAVEVYEALTEYPLNTESKQERAHNRIYTQDVKGGNFPIIQDYEMVRECINIIADVE